MVFVEYVHTCGFEGSDKLVDKCAVLRYRLNAALDLVEFVLNDLSFQGVARVLAELFAPLNERCKVHIVLVVCETGVGEKVRQFVQSLFVQVDYTDIHVDWVDALQL